MICKGRKDADCCWHELGEPVAEGMGDVPFRCCHCGEGKTEYNKIRLHGPFAPGKPFMPEPFAGLPEHLQPATDIKKHQYSNL